MRRIAILAILALAGCAGSNPEHKKIEEIAKRNPLDMRNEDAQTIVIKKEQKKPQYPKVPTINSKIAPFVCTKSSRVYHVRGCEFAGKMDALKGYESWPDAERAGHIPCEFCRPRDNGAADQREALNVAR